jgi:hypothetical protein
VQKLNTQHIFHPLIIAFKSRAQAIFSLSEKTRIHPLVYKICVREIFYSLFYIISTQRSHIYQKLNTNREKFQICSVFFIHPVYIYIYNFQTERKQKTKPTTFELLDRYFDEHCRVFCLRTVWKLWNISLENIFSLIITLPSEFVLLILPMCKFWDPNHPINDLER